MVSSDDKIGGKDPAKVNTMISDFRAAWIDLLGARCAIDRLRLRYSAEEVAQFAERATLNKSLDAVHAMCDYFSEIRKYISTQS
ncbi:MAG TPA: hypothetical protein VLK33_22720 [Terriglobales bacterium]|nr:hypothetical protein [Terriglobales bacterium]